VKLELLDISLMTEAVAASEGVVIAARVEETLLVTGAVADAAPVCEMLIAPE
jgi:hypothetical protein